MNTFLSSGNRMAREFGAKLHAHTGDLSIAGALLLLVLGIYFPVRHFDFIGYDDGAYVRLNEHVLAGLRVDGLRWALTDAEDANWIPLTRISLMADRQFSGARDEITARDVHAGPYHWTNVLLHAAATLLLFGLLKRISGASGPSALVAFLFALHPQHVESVAWVSERKDVLSGLFWMLALWSYARYTSRPRIGTYLLTLLLYCLGFLSKPMVVTLPVVFLLLDVWPLKRLSIPLTAEGWKPVRRLVWEKVPFFVLALAMSATTYVVQKQGGAVRTLADLPLGPRLANAVISAALYIGQTVWPTHLAILYPPEVRPAWQLIAAALLLAGITFLALRSIRTRPYLAVGWLWYLVTILPVIGIIQVGYQARADRYTYIPTIGLSLMLAWSAADAWQRWPKVRPALAGLGGAACLACMALTWRQIPYWEDSRTLFQHSIEVTGPNAIAHTCLAEAWREEEMNDQAIAEYRKALAIGPPPAAAPGILINLGTLLSFQGRYAEAIGPLTRAVQLKPGDSILRSNLGKLLAKQGHPGEAVTQFEAAIRLKPDDWEAHIWLGDVLSSLGRIDEARTQFSKGGLPPMDAAGKK